jgi:predicted nucleic acid-binding protein
MTLVDTSVWIDFFAARNTAQVKVLESIIDQGEDLCLCGVILTEVLQGIRDDKEHKQTESVLSSLIYLPMDQSTFLLAANLYRTLRSRGITIRNSVDCMITAVCIEHKTVLLHNDKDFDHISGVFGLQILGSPAVQ